MPSDVDGDGQGGVLGDGGGVVDRDRGVVDGGDIDGHRGGSVRPLPSETV